jgi:hypothetical protein
MCDYYEEQLDILCQNQRNILNQSQDDLDIALDVIRQVYRPENLLIMNMVGFQAMTMPVCNIGYKTLQYSVSVSESVSLDAVGYYMAHARTRASKTKCPTNRCDIRDTVESLINEITEEVIIDLRRNAGTYETYDSPACVLNKLAMLSSEIYKKTLYNGDKNWIVAHPEAIAKYFPDFNICKKQYGKYELKRSMGVAGILDIFSYEKMPENEILFGMCGSDRLQRGYFYCPFIAASRIEGWPVFATRNGKFLRSNKFYGKVLIK